MPRMPENGARIVLRSMVARISPTRASAWRGSAVALSYSASRDHLLVEQLLHALEVEACELALRFGRRQLRLLLPRVQHDQHVALATLARTRRRSRSTMPGRSALTVTPRTAAIVPMASSVAGHSACSATMVVTASGGG